MIDRLGKYRISEVLGKGAMGVVYKGFDPDIQRTVALKTIRKELVDEDQATQLLARFRNEAQAAGRLTHPGIVAVYDFGDDGEVAFIAMEFVAGNPLREYFSRNTRFAHHDAVSIMVQLLDALDYAHEQGVWHRDIKPANLIVTTAGKVKVADFGIARIEASNLTMTGAIMGTPGYMAPEQYRGGAIDARVDLFAAGVVLYQLLTSVKPFNGTPEQTGFQTCYENPPPPSMREGAQEVERFDPVAMKALAKKPEERYQSAAEFRTALLAAHASPVSPVVSEDTIIVEPIRAAQRTDPTSPSRGLSGSRTPGGSKMPTTFVPPGWDGAVLKQIETQLARFVGPMAKVLVKRAAMVNGDIEALYVALANDLERHADRQAFLQTRLDIRVAPPAPIPEPSTPAPRTRSTGVTSRGTTIELTPEVIERATRALATHLGPIANMVAKKAAAQAPSRREFYRILAENLATERDRTQFLKDVGG